MPLQYSINYIGHIVEGKRPEGFPRTVMINAVVEVENNKAGLQAATKQGLDWIIKTGGMIVPKDPTALIDITKFNADKEIYVPIHMLAFVETKTFLISDKVPSDNSLSKG